MNLLIKAGNLFQISLGLCEEGGPDAIVVGRALVDFDLFEEFQKFAIRPDPTVLGDHNGLAPPVMHLSAHDAAEAFLNHLRLEGIAEPTLITGQLHLQTDGEERLSELNFGAVTQSSDQVIVIGFSDF